MSIPDNDVLTEKSDRLVAFSYHGEDGTRVLSIYGDPAGLRNLARILNNLADLDQSALPESSLPANEGFHQHISPGDVLHEQSSPLVLGRLDAKKDSNSTWLLRGLKGGGFDF